MRATKKKRIVEEEVYSSQFEEADKKKWQALEACRPPASSFEMHELEHPTEETLAPSDLFAVAGLSHREYRKRQKELLGQYRIYSLTDPRTNNVFYVGMTTIGLKLRLYKHLCKGNNTGAGPRVRELRRLGYRPIITTLELTTDPAREVFWIQNFISLGTKLKNKQLRSVVSFRHREP